MLSADAHARYFRGRGLLWSPPFDDKAVIPTFQLVTFASVHWHPPIVASEEGEGVAKKRRCVIEQSLHGEVILPDFSVQTQTDFFLDLAVP